MVTARRVGSQQAVHAHECPVALTPADSEDAGSTLTEAHSGRHPHRVAQSSPDVIQVKGRLTPGEHQSPLNP